MSEREDIAAHIVSTLSAVSSPITFGKVERNPFDAEELSQQQFPAVLYKLLTRQEKILQSRILA